MIYIGVGDVPWTSIPQVNELKDWDIEYDGQGYYCKWKVIEVLDFPSYPKPDRAINGLQSQRLPRNVIFVCDYPVMEGGVSRDGYAWWVKDKPGLLQNFRKAWDAPAHVVGHWYSRDAAEKWMKGGISLPEGGYEETNWHTEYHSSIPGTDFWICHTDVTSAVLDMEEGRKVMLRD